MLEMAKYIWFPRSSGPPWWHPTHPPPVPCGDQETLCEGTNGKYSKYSKLLSGRDNPDKIFLIWILLNCQVSGVERKISDNYIDWSPASNISCECEVRGSRYWTGRWRQWEGIIAGTAGNVSLSQAEITSQARLCPNNDRVHHQLTTHWAGAG